MKTLCVGLLCALSVAGCSGYRMESGGSPVVDLQTAPPAGLAKICIVRSQSRFAASRAVIRDNGGVVGITSGRSYLCYLAQPGDHVLRTESEYRAAETRTHAVAGGSYYLNQAVRVSWPNTRWSKAGPDPAFDERAPTVRIEQRWSYPKTLVATRSST